MVREITVPEALKLPGAVFVDVRSPSEYNQAGIPDAVNIPLLSDQERAEIGKAYHQQSPEQAKLLGLKLVSPKLDSLVRQYKDRCQDQPLIVYCWRGGLRSHSIAAVLEMSGITVYCLQGGYKAYRRLVQEYLYELPLKPTAVVLHGLTGVGKTEILTELGRLGVAAIDLENLARHRGSVFGDIGMGTQPTQKVFESALFLRLKETETAAFFAVESESRKIGRLFVPPSVSQAMKQGHHILIHTNITNRIARLLQVYQDEAGDSQGRIIDSIKQLTPRLGRQKVNDLVTGVCSGNLEWVAETLLLDYYDPLYGYSDHADAAFELSVESTNPAAAAKKIMVYLAGIKGHDKGVGKCQELGRSF